CLFFLRRVPSCPSWINCFHAGAPAECRTHLDSGPAAAVLSEALLAVRGVAAAGPGRLLPALPDGADNGPASHLPALLQYRRSPCQPCRWLPTLPETRAGLHGFAAPGNL